MYDKLIQALAEIDRPGDICTSGDLPLTMPGLVVEGLGMLRLPLGESQARELVARCRQVPYGKGTKTLVDTAVRRAWELDPKHIQFTNPKWTLLISSIIGEVQKKLGLESSKLTAHLYKLLVYEEGSFFLPHRDGEKLDRMVATLDDVIDSNRCDLSHVTERRGRPYTLVCTKTTASYGRASDIYERDLKSLARIMKLEKRGLAK